MKSEGLGDTIKKIIDATGAERIVRFVNGKKVDTPAEPCTPCEERRKKLNKLFPYVKPDTTTGQGS